MAYSKGIQSIADDLLVSKDKAQEIYDAIMVAFPKLKAYIDHVAEFAKIHGYVESFYGRRRRVPDLFLPPYEVLVAKGSEWKYPESLDRIFIDSTIGKISRMKWYTEKKEYIEELATKGIEIKDNKWLISKAERQLTNATIQSSAASITKKAMVLIHNNKRLRELDLWLELSIHDELVASCPIENAQEAMPIMNRCMIEAGSDLKATLKCDSELSLSWYGESLEFTHDGRLVTAVQNKKEKDDEIDAEYIDIDEEEDEEDD